MAYGTPIDEVVETVPRSFTRRLWLKLAFAALDQADITPGLLLDMLGAARKTRSTYRGWNALLWELGETP